MFMDLCVVAGEPQHPSWIDGRGGEAHKGALQEVYGTEV